MIVCAFLIIALIHFSANSKLQIETATEERHQDHVRLKRDEYDDFVKKRLEHERRLANNHEENKRKQAAADREKKAKANPQPPPYREKEQQKKTPSRAWIWIILAVVIGIFTAIGLCKLCAMKQKSGSNTSPIYQQVTREPRVAVSTSAHGSSATTHIIFTSSNAANSTPHPAPTPSNFPEASTAPDEAGGTTNPISGLPSAPLLEPETDLDPPPDYYTATKKI